MAIKDNGLPTSIVIFGASGDLTQRKLIPSLFNLYCKGRLPKTFRIVGYGGTAFTEDKFRAHLKEAWKNFRIQNIPIRNGQSSPRMLYTLNIAMNMKTLCNWIRFSRIGRARKVTVCIIWRLRRMPIQESSNSWERQIN